MRYHGCVLYVGKVRSIITAEVILKFSPAATRWEKKKADRNFMSTDSNDCLVWCLVEVPAVYEAIQVITDTSRTKEWIYFYLTTEEEAYVEIDLNCSDEFPLTFLEDLEYFLNKEGHWVKQSRKYNKLNGRLRMALGEYQLRHQLSVAGVTNKTYQYLLKSGIRR